MKKLAFCARGHRMSGENLYINPAGDRRSCRGCIKIYRASYYETHERKRYESGRYTYEATKNIRFGGNREKAILRDGERCVMCGMTRSTHKELYNRDITVDHIDGNGRYVSPQLMNNNLNNLQTLCLPCHGHKDGSRARKKVLK